MNLQNFQFYTMIYYKVAVIEGIKCQFKLSSLRKWEKCLGVKTYVQSYYLKNKRIQECYTIPILFVAFAN